MAESIAHDSPSTPMRCMIPIPVGTAQMSTCSPTSKNNTGANIIGFKLHLEDPQGSESDCGPLTFYRQHTHNVYVGRMPSSSSEVAADDKALFKCPVVSRSHAKFVFTDAGCMIPRAKSSFSQFSLRDPLSVDYTVVDVIDLGSHHGTHIRRSHESFSTMIAPDNAVSLGDGDVVIFGKTVGRSTDAAVDPVAVRMELLVGDISSSRRPLQPLFVPDYAIHPTSSPSSRSVSGRYGLPSSGSSSPSEEAYSPTWNQNEFEDDEIQVIENPNRSLNPNSQFTGYTPRVLGMLEKLKNTNAPAHKPTYEEPEEEEESIRNSSRFTSPMDLGSPSSDHMDLESPASPVGEEIHSNPWVDPSTTMRSHIDLMSVTPPPERPARTVIIIDDDPKETQDEGVSNSNPGTEDNAEVATSQITAPNDTLVANAVSCEKLTTLETTVAGMKADINKLNMKRLDYKSCFNANVRRTNKRLTVIDSRVAEINDLCASLEERLTNCEADDCRTDIEQLNGKLATLQDVVDVVTANATAQTIPDLQVERDDVKASIASIHQLVKDMENLKGNMKARLQAELDAVRAISAETIAEIKEHHRSFISVGPTSLKRKRLDEEDIEDADMPVSVRVIRTDLKVGEGEHQSTSTLVDSGIPVASLSADAAGTTLSIEGGIRVPHRKRARKVAAALAQTAASMTVGAVAAWSALAFF